MRPRNQAGFRPLSLVEIELGRAGPGAVGPQPTALGPALCLARLHTRPLGQLALEGRATAIPTSAVYEAATRRFAAEIAEHLATGGCGPDDQAPTGRPRCLVTRDRLLASPPTVSVIIATRNRPDLLAECLRSLRALDYPSFETIVVDNAASTPAAGSVAEARAAGLEVTYLKEPVAGLARAHNRGLAVAGGEIAAFVDDDVIVDSQWLAETAAAFRAVPDAGCVTGMILPAELATEVQYRLHSHWGMNKGFRRRVFDFAGGSGGAGRLHPYTAGQLGSGANMAFRTPTLRAIGGFDVAIGAGTRARGGDDLSSFFQILAAGHRLVYEPAAFVHHRYSRDAGAARRVAYGYGVGLGAYLTKTVIDRPARISDVVPRIPAGVAHSLRMRGAAGDGPRCPRHLVALERLGLVCGPASYLASRRATRAPAAVGTA